MTHLPIIIAVLGDISNPRQRLIPTFFNNLEIPNLDTRDRKVRDFKFDSDGRSFLNVRVCFQVQRDESDEQIIGNKWTAKN
jgi:hypothetical protein